MRLIMALLTFILVSVAALPHGTVQAQIRPLFTVGIEGGFTGAIMHASVYPNGTVVILRSGGGRPPHQSRTTVPLTRSSVTAAIQLAQRQRIFALPKSVQNATFGADIPIIALTVYTAHGPRSVHAMGTEISHAPGAGRLFPVWGIFYALAGYPAQVG